MIDQHTQDSHAEEAGGDALESVIVRELRAIRTLLAGQQAELLTGPEAARFAGVGKTTWYQLVAAGEAPAPVNISGIARWSRRSLLEWIEAKKKPSGKKKG